MSSTSKDKPIELLKNSENIILNSYFSEYEFIKIGTCKCYNKNIANILLYTDKVLNANNEIIDFNKSPYKKTFFEAYKEGTEHFSKDFNITASIVYGNNSKKLIADLHNLYYHDDILGYEKGLNHIKKLDYRIFTHKVVRNIGYYSGILYCIDESIKKFPNAFINFHKCIEHTNKNSVTTNISESDKLLLKLDEYGFSNLEKVKIKDKIKIINLLVSNKLPYKIAMLDFLGFISFIRNEYSDFNESKLNLLLAKILNTNKRAIKGNINVLKSEKSKDKPRYTAYIHKETVKNHYQILK